MMNYIEALYISIKGNRIGAISENSRPFVDKLTGLPFPPYGGKLAQTID